MTPAVSRLLASGVCCPHPDSLYVADDVDAARIAPGVVLHPGCRILGGATSMGPGCVIGAEAPATVENCRLAAGVHLKGGYSADSVFWDGVVVGSGAHIRPGCLLEEESSAAHAVGLKQTILFPFVTLGSLINFCDVLMAGGTSRKNHGEVGSSYIHFNFTPQQDKATASRIGDVPRGVLLDQPPVFLGGQGGLVGPRRIAFGTLIVAGAVCRKDVVEPGLVIVPTPLPPGEKPFDPLTYGAVRARFMACLEYLGHIHALRAWYRHARPALVSGAAWHQACVEGGRDVLELIWQERVKRLSEWVDKLPASTDGVPEEHQFVRAAWRTCSGGLPSLSGQEGAVPARDRFLSTLTDRTGGYVSRVHGLSPGARAAATAWLEGVVDEVVGAFRNHLQRA